MYKGGHPLGSERVGKVGLCVAIFEVSEIRCRFEFQICLKGGTFSVQRGWARLDFCGPIFEVFEIKSKAKFLAYKCSGRYLKFLKSGVESRLRFV